MQKNMFLIASLLILVGMGAITVSCKKEKANNFRRAEITTEKSNDKDGGDEDPIIRVRVKKKHTLVAIDSAFVETYTYGTNVLSNSGYTNKQGEYDRQVTAGIYYFNVTIPGSSTPFVTDTIHVNNDVQANIFVD